MKIRNNLAGNDLVEIPLSKRKLIWMTMGSLAFCCIGIWLLIDPHKTDHPFLGSLAVTYMTGLVTFLFFGFGVFIFIRKLLSDNPGFIISRDGLTDNSSGVAAGYIPWEDIQDVINAEIMNQRCILIMVKNPLEYLEKVRNPLKRKTMHMNYKMCGTPISVSANSLKINYDNLFKLIIHKMDEYKS
ncbi:MAG TPA: STM3941 family protein [Bacteroidales bacterium]|nr:STM3941 family protein [Bacteroidales bacterium]